MGILGRPGSWNCPKPNVSLETSSQILQNERFARDIPNKRKLAFYLVIYRAESQKPAFRSRRPQNRNPPALFDLVFFRGKNPPALVKSKPGVNLLKENPGPRPFPGKVRTYVSEKVRTYVRTYARPASSRALGPSWRPLGALLSTSKGPLGPSWRLSIRRGPSWPREIDE